MKNNLTAIIFGLAIVIAAYVLGYSFMNRNNTDGTISVTGLGKADFTSDLIVWEGSFPKKTETFNKRTVIWKRIKKLFQNTCFPKE